LATLLLLPFALRHESLFTVAYSLSLTHGSQSFQPATLRRALWPPEPSLVEMSPPLESFGTFTGRQRVPTQHLGLLFEIVLCHFLRSAD
jgi:hypothetical protein